MKDNFRRIILLIMLLAMITIFGTRDVTGLLIEAGFELGLLQGNEAEIAALQVKLDSTNRLREILTSKAEAPGPLARFLDFDATEQLAEFDTEISKTEAEIRNLISSIEAEEQAQIPATAAVEASTSALEDNEGQVRALAQAVRQAEGIELSFARATEDAARKLGRSQEKLGRDQARARDKLLIGQQKQLDEFEADRLEKLADFEEDRTKQIADTEKDIAKEEARAQRDRQRQQENFQRQSRQSEERFDLDRIQSRRRFTLDETRLRGEGDILGLQQLRENFALSEQEAAESFGLQEHQSKENQEVQTKDQEEEQRDRLAELRQHLDEQRIELEQSLEEQRADLLIGFDEQLLDLQQSQLEQREALAESLAEQEEDRRISQQRQLEDLGRSLAAQEDLTHEGAAAIAQQLEEAFGVEGVADQIMSGFTMRQESAFQKLFEEITEGAKTAMEQLEKLDVPVRDFGRPTIQTAGGRQLPGFEHGGVVPGAIGSPQVIQAHGGETVLPTQQQTFRMPIAMPNRVDHVMSGGTTINVAGLEGASQATVDRAVEAMIETQDIALKRILRRYGVR